MSARLQIQFLGLNEGDDPKNLPPGTLLRAENVRMDKARRLAKRMGVSALGTNDITGDYESTSGRRLVFGGSATSIVTGDEAWTHVESLGKWNRIDRPPPWRIERRPLLDSGRSVGPIDTAISGNMLVTFFAIMSPTSAGATIGLFVQVDDVATGAPIVPPMQVSTSGGWFVRVLISGTTALLSWVSGTAIRYRKLSLASFALSTADTSLISSVSSDASFDVVLATPTAGVPTLFYAYSLGSGTDRLKLTSYAFSTMVQANDLTVTSSGNDIDSIAVTFGATSQKVACMFERGASSGSVHLASCSSALASVVGPTSIATSLTAVSSLMVAEDDATNILTGYVYTGSGFRLVTQLRSWSAHAQVAASVRDSCGFLTVSRPWKSNGRWFVSATTTQGDAQSGTQRAQPSSVILEVETASPSLSGVTGGVLPHMGTLENHTAGWSTELREPSCAVDGSGNVWVAAAYRKRESLSHSLPISPAEPIGWNLYRLSWADEDTFRSAKLGPCSLMAGGAPAWWDGISALPYGFYQAPQIVSVAAAAGGSMVAGTYSYVATYAWTDAAGLLHRSMPSPPVMGTTSGGNLSLTVTVRTTSAGKQHASYGATNVANPVIIEIWRTTVGGTGPHYRLTREPIYQMLINEPAAGSRVLTDTRADADITGAAAGDALNKQPQLYTDLGELENVPPPAFVTCITHRPRLAGIGPDLRTVWLSKDSTIDATLAPGFNEALTLAFPSDKTALASLDAVLVVFGEDSIDVVHGDGPDDKGDQNTWQIQSVQTDVGCINPRSVVTTPMGVVFESRRGLDLLDRGLGVTTVLGRNVVDTLALYPNITSAVLVAEHNEIRFTCDDGSNGIVLAYDYQSKIWFTRKYNDGYEHASVKFADAALIDGVYTLLTSRGRVLRESSTVSWDNGAYIETDIVLAPISAQPGQSGWSNANISWQRAKDLTLMGTGLAPHDLKVSFALNYATSYSQTHTFAANAPGTPAAAGPRELARVTLAVQKCQAVQVRIQDTAPTGYAVASTQAGVALESLSLRVAAKEGPPKTSAGQQA